MFGEVARVRVYGGALFWDPVREARDAEQRGFDGVRVLDHFSAPASADASFAVPHSLVTLGAAAAATSRIGLTQTVLCNTFRNPAEIAQAIATLHRISGGRAELGLGAGWHRGEHEAFGYPFPGPVERLERLREAVSICRAMLRGNGVVSFEGRYYRAVHDVPWPELPSVPRVMVGGTGAKLLALAGELADRVDLVHGNRGGLPFLGGELHNGVRRIGGLRDIAVRAGEAVGNVPAFSATILVSLSQDAGEVARRRAEVAAATGATVDEIAADLLYVVGTQGDLRRVLDTVAGLGFDRVHLGAVPPDAAATLDLISELLPG
ncbi:MAG TPA: LLM class flavin-dependent oxidoreductase [Pseudonocardiaceae bacterium]|jgi:alkanesulfonate monooxygenase SsuD/methylene tetrahydromethanopterin reductase-like flavin-dependent oxidoreductase (luciferase family)|nr:LLM class flavin-dependent oxidoreductase [Pseudonocardiaceae bacterium]